MAPPPKQLLGLIETLYLFPNEEKQLEIKNKKRINIYLFIDKSNIKVLVTCIFVLFLHVVYVVENICTKNNQSLSVEVYY